MGVWGAHLLKFVQSWRTGRGLLAMDIKDRISTTLILLLRVVSLVAHRLQLLL